MLDVDLPVIEVMQWQKITSRSVVNSFTRAFFRNGRRRNCLKREKWQQNNNFFLKIVAFVVSFSSDETRVQLNSLNVQLLNNAQFFFRVCPCCRPPILPQVPDFHDYRPKVRTFKRVSREKWPFLAV